MKNKNKLKNHAAIAESANVMTKTQKTRIYRFKEFNPTTGKVQTCKNGGVLLQANMIGQNQFEGCFVVCPKDKVFHKPTAIRQLTAKGTTPTILLRGTDEMDVLLAKILIRTDDVTTLLEYMAAIINSVGRAASHKEQYDQKMKFSGAKVYDYF